MCVHVETKLYVTISSSAHVHETQAFMFGVSECTQGASGGANDWQLKYQEGLLEFEVIWVE